MKIRNEDDDRLIVINEKEDGDGVEAILIEGIEEVVLGLELAGEAVVGLEGELFSLLHMHGGLKAGLEGVKNVATG